MHLMITKNNANTPNHIFLFISNYYKEQFNIQNIFIKVLNYKFFVHGEIIF